MSKEEEEEDEVKVEFEKEEEEKSTSNSSEGCIAKDQQEHQSVMQSHASSLSLLSLLSALSLPPFSSLPLIKEPACTSNQTNGTALVLFCPSVQRALSFTPRESMEKLRLTSSLHPLQEL